MFKADAAPGVLAHGTSRREHGRLAHNHHTDWTVVVRWPAICIRLRWRPSCVRMGGCQHCFEGGGGDSRGSSLSATRIACHTRSHGCRLQVTFPVRPGRKIQCNTERQSIWCCIVVTLSRLRAGNSDIFGKPSEEEPWFVLTVVGYEPQSNHNRGGLGTSRLCLDRTLDPAGGI